MQRKEIVKEFEIKMIVTITVPADMLDEGEGAVDVAAMEKLLVGECIKVKSGLFENLGIGNIDSIQSVESVDSEYTVWGESEEEDEEVAA